MKKLTYSALTLAVAAAITGCQSTASVSQQDVVDQLANNLNLEYQVLNTHAGAAGVDCKAMEAEWAACQTARITLTNQGEAINPGQDFEIYFHSIRRILDLNSDEFEVTHLTGDLNKLTPTDKFKGFPANGSIEVDFVAEYWSLFESDVMPRYYISMEGAEPRIIANTDSEDTASYVTAMTDVEMRKRHPGDNNVFHAAETRFEENKQVGQLEVAGQILPSPKYQDASVTGTVTISNGMRVIAPSMQKDSLKAATDRLQTLGASLDGEYPVKVNIAAVSFEGEDAVPGSYTLEVTEEGAHVVGYDQAGAFYGLQSLAALLPADFATSKTLSKVKVADAPRFEHRGMHADIARNFHGKESILRLLEQMGAYKLNTFHFHLTDDEGWRLEIPGLPELTEVGSKRCHDLSEQSCLLPQLGSGPYADNNGSGYLTVADYEEILSFARARHIDVIPEIDMPAHARAAVVSMEARYNRLKDTDLAAAEQYRLKDPKDDSNYTTIQFYNDGILNPCIDSTYNFVDKVITEVAQMHQRSGLPLSTWHMGGDEAKNIHLGNGYEQSGGETAWKGDKDLEQENMPWEKSAACTALIDSDDSLSTTVDLGPYFVRNVADIIARNGIAGSMAWQDGLKGVESSEELSTAQSKVNVWETLYWGGTDVSNKFVEKGFQVVQSHPDYLYFDFPYENHQKERGYYWATRYTNEEKVFRFSPGNLPQNAETSIDRDGNHFAVKPSKHAIDYHGIQGQFWSETVRTADQFDYHIFPRLLPLAERAWSKPDWELAYNPEREFKGGETNFVDHAAQDADWSRFANIMGQKELAKMDKFGVQYRLPVPGAIRQDGKLVANVAMPGLTVEYSTDGQTWTQYQQPVAVTGTVTLRTVSPDGSRVSRETVLN